jgi:rhodanese-related sulfurtransferase/rubrerythrin
MNTEEAREYMTIQSEGTYTILDVRQPWEYEKEHLPGGRLIPLGELMERIGELNQEKPVIVHCASGRRSQIAAQLMTGMGFREVYNLEGGIRAWNGRKLAGSVDEGIRFLKGDERAEDVIVLAYAMEVGLGSFYSGISAKTQDKETAALFSRLSKVEDGHKNVVFKLYNQFDSSVADQRAFETRIVPKVMEGGLTPDEFLNKYSPVLKTLQDVLELAMTIEAQAMDLYIRYSDRVKNLESKRILHALAQAEKTHLKSLGASMDRLGS